MARLPVGHCPSTGGGLGGRAFSGRLLVVAPLRVSLSHTLPPVLGVLLGGIRPHAVHLTAFVALFHPLVLEAVVPVSVGVTKALG